MALRDLHELGEHSKEQYENSYNWREIALSPDFKRAFKTDYESDGNGEVFYGHHTCRVTTRENLTIDFPNQWFEIASFFTDFLREGNKYREAALRCYDRLAERTELDNSHRKDFFTAIRESGETWQEALADKFSATVAQEFDTILNEELPDNADKELILRCITEKGWSFSSKTIDRGDYFNAAILYLAQVVHVSQSYLAQLVCFLSENPGIENMLDDGVIPAEEITPAPPARGEVVGDGINLIVYGAPGAGKSHYIDQKTRGGNVIRTVFHPEYQNSDFLGGLRPAVNDRGEVTYSFSPGPFIKALLQASNTGEHVYLVIEEINRANAAAVFGDVFQLLDRNSDGEGQYTITPDEALGAYLVQNGYDIGAGIRIPSNLSVYATMNSSDQGVFLLDTAFKRRWQFHYCPLAYDRFSDKASFIDQVVPYGGGNYSWTLFASTINNALKGKDVEEDRLIGPYFLSDTERADALKCGEAISGKLLIYLWDDVLRHGLRNEIFNPKYRTFADLVGDYKSGVRVFSDAINSKLPQDEQAEE